MKKMKKRRFVAVAVAAGTVWGQKRKKWKMKFHHPSWSCFQTFASKN